MILLSLLPTLAYLLLLKAMDVFSMIKWHKLGISILYGMLSTILALAISRGYALCAGASWEAVWVSPLIEEVLKAAPLILFIMFSHRIAFLCEAMIYGAAVGAGFALAENGLYLYYNPEMTLLTAIVRGFSTALLHLGCTALVASLALQIVEKIRHRSNSISAIVILSFVPSWLLHTFYNSMILDPYLLIFLVIAGMLALFYLIGRWNEQSTVDWLDVSMTTHVALLTALREGHLEETKAGQYLISIKERCDSEVFFDMVVYMQLYIELLIEAKSRVLLHEVGLDKEPTTTAEKEKREDKYRELKTLETRIPRFNRILLRPILHYDKADYWAIDECVAS